MSPLEQLKSVLCDPEGKCCILGSDEDRAIIDRALQALAPPAAAQPEQEPVVFYRCKGCGHAYEQMTRCDCMASDGFDRLEYYNTPPAAAQPDLADEVIGCFNAAEIEGLTAALANTTDEHLKDLVERRLMYALYAAQEAKEKSE